MKELKHPIEKTDSCFILANQNISFEIARKNFTAILP